MKTLSVKPKKLIFMKQRSIFPVSGSTEHFTFYSTKHGHLVRRNTHSRLTSLLFSVIKTDKVNRRGSRNCTANRVPDCTDGYLL